ncbi:MAG: hypothetical protein NC225_11040 [Clostridium sp.]|nr:hypothetical protein [Clostridium sp.]MCM1460258.1 hypothetical protein [Bacteroides sp.]
MRKENQKKHLKIIILIVIVIVAVIAILSVFYFRKTEWVMERGAKGQFSKETYLDGGTGEWEYDENMRIYYSFNISSGSVCFQLTNEKGDIVYNMAVDKSCEGYIYLSDVGTGVLYDHEFALSEDTRATSYTEIQYKRSNWQKFKSRVRMKFPAFNR